MSTITIEFTKEQLIAYAEHVIKTASEYPHTMPAQADKRLAEIALAAMTAPDYIPPHILDAMSEMCDGGFNAQGNWDLCRESVMPPAPCSRCGTISDRPDGEHYCHSKSQ